jgi:hypothetical protein
MIRGLPLLATLLIVACNRDAQPDDNMASVANGAAVEQSANKCRPPILAMEGGTQPLGSALLDETRENFAAAVERACAAGLLKDNLLIDAKAADRSHLFLINAPEANVASIYLSEVDGNRMVLEYPFLTSDGKSQVPSPAELEEAIYCAVHGATAEEQESSGRCLVD